MNINIGIQIDLQKLLDSRLLIQAGSGGGKSYAVRKTVEAVAHAGSVQQIIIDPEGEFVTLREKFDFALIGKDGDIPLSLKYAEALAHKLLETGVSAIIDLYELKHHERILFVKRFLDAVINAPKELWHECLIYIDEAHIFCPESSKSESMSAVIDLCTRGRKRGFAAVLATQRLSKLHKDAAAECLNKMIGRTGLDIDRKRAAEELGMTSKVDALSLRDLTPGQFYAFGPAISNEVRKFTVAKVATTHMESGRRLANKPATPKAIAKILEKLSGIPEEAEKDLTTKQQLQAEVTRLRGELTRVSKGTPMSKVNPNELKEASRLARQEAVLEYKPLIKEYEEKIRLASSQIAKFLGVIKKINELSSGGQVQLPPLPQTKLPALDRKDEIRETRFIQNDSKPPISAEGNRPLGRCAREILRFLATYPEREWSKAQVGIATGYSPGSGGFNNALSELNSAQLIERSNTNLRVNAGAFDRIQAIIGPIESKKYDIFTFKEKLGKCEREIYEVLLEHPHDRHSKESLASKTPSNYSPGSGGFNNALGRLTTLELITRNNGTIMLNPELIELIN